MEAHCLCPFTFFQSLYAIFLNLKFFFLIDLYLCRCSSFLFFIALTIYSFAQLTLYFISVSTSPSSFLSLLNPRYPLCFPPSLSPSVSFVLFFLPSLNSELCRGCIIDRHLYLWHLLLLSLLLPSLVLSPSFPRAVCAWPDAAWQVLRPTSIFHTSTTHINTNAHKIVHIHIQQLSQNVCAWGAQEWRVVMGGRRIKITFPLPSRLCDSACRGDFDKCYNAMKA